jgi:hypothetical protein
MTELQQIKAALQDRPDQKESASSEDLTLAEVDQGIVESLSILLNIHAVENGTNSRVVELYRELAKLHTRIAVIDEELEKYEELSGGKIGGGDNRSGAGDGSTGRQNTSINRWTLHGSGG